ncbi:MAG: amino acid permease [Geminicoccaceae bacterium]
MLIAAAACISTFGTLNGFTLLTGQVPFGAARDGLFPPAFARASAAGTPATALVVSNGLASILIAMNYSRGMVEQFVFITLLATLTTLVPYLFCSLAELMIRCRTDKRLEGYHLRFALALAALGFLYSIWTIYGAGQEIVFYGFLLTMAGTPIFVWLKWNNRGATSAPQGR